MLHDFGLEIPRLDRGFFANPSLSPCGKCNFGSERKIKAVHMLLNSVRASNNMDDNNKQNQVVTAWSVGIIYAFSVLLGDIEGLIVKFNVFDRPMHSNGNTKISRAFFFYVSVCNLNRL